jgi:hypothetical protein
MHLRIQSFPPLGEVTTCSTGFIQLTVVLEVPKGQNQDLWEVELWRSIDGSTWAGQRAAPYDSSCEPITFRRLSNSVATLHYIVALDVLWEAQFTLRFRRGSGDSWSWAKDVTGYEDGYIIVPNSEPSAKGDLPLPDLGAEWRVSKRASQSPGTTLWALETDVKASDDHVSAYKDVVIGKPWGSFLRYISTQLIVVKPMN